MVLYNRNIHERNKVLSKFNKDLNQEIVERKKIEATLQERDKYMDRLV